MILHNKMFKFTQQQNILLFFSAQTGLAILAYSASNRIPVQQGSTLMRNSVSDRRSICTSSTSKSNWTSISFKPIAPARTAYYVLTNAALTGNSLSFHIPDLIESFLSYSNCDKDSISFHMSVLTGTFDIYAVHICSRLSFFDVRHNRRSLSLQIGR